MGKITKPMLAGTLDDIDKLEYPLLATPKLDGVRCLIVGGVAMTRSFKPFPNTHIRTEVSKLPEGFDGEIVVKGKAFNEITHDVMREDGTPSFTYAVFDYCTELSMEYSLRMEYLKEAIVPNFVEKILPKEIKSKDELLEYETKCLSEGYEGVMLRKPSGKYKLGRSTAKEGLLLKMKRFTDSEAEILEIVEQTTNNNIAEKDAFGHSKRSSAMSGLVGANTMGSLKVKDIKTGVEFGLGTGFSSEQRNDIWKNKKDLIGKIVRYKYQSIGTLNLPRFPSFQGIRSELDI